ncbi:MAG: glycosyltransferase family 2 protein, partial [Coriobacteriia bacterium]|nr:glycosyltransferase family 2 protein [Coriobacteriia bacterium]
MQRFSIIVPAYNAEATLAETLEAIIGQEYADWECIVVDDGSTDGTLDLARRFAKREARVRVIHQQNRGSAGAYNTGAREAAGEWI